MTASNSPPSADDPAYLRGVVDDEVRLGHLLRWTNIDVPPKLVPNLWLWGSRGETGLAARIAHTVLPRWRRDWAGAGELMARCDLGILQGPDTVAVSARSGAPAVVRFADHPTRDAAIRAAMCQAAIACLSLERADGEAQLAAQRAARAAREQQERQA